MTTDRSSFDNRISRWKRRVRLAVAEAGLVSVMNDTKWRALVKAVYLQLPFQPCYQIKDVQVARPEPERFEGIPSGEGDWSSEGLFPFFSIEWMKVRPAILRRVVGATPIHEDISNQFETVLKGCRVPFRHDGDSLMIYGYAPPGLVLIR